MNSSLLAGLNLAGFMLVASFLAHAIALEQWRRRRTASVPVLILLGGQVWLIPQAISFFALHSTRLLAALWLGNWIAGAVAVALFPLALRGRSRDLADAARLDGAGSIATYRHVTWPMMKPALLVLALILIMATWAEFARPLLRGAGRSVLSGTLEQWQLSGASSEIAIVLAISFLATLPVLALSYFARRTMVA